MKAPYMRVVTAGETATSDRGTLDFPSLLAQGADAHVGVTIGFSTDYGKAKCTVSITVTCAQNLDEIERAADMCMTEAERLANEGMSRIVKEI